MSKYKLYIGIDPDVEASGVATWNSSTKTIGITALSFWKLYDHFCFLKEHSTVFVRIEAGWLNKKSNFHDQYGQKKFVGEMIAKKVGSNHQVGKLIGQMCEYLNIQYEFVKPMGKVTPEYFTQLTGISVKKKDQDKIDAAMLVFGL